MQYYFGLDLIRFTSALLVVFFHLGFVHQKLFYVAWPGWVGVEIFFVISGFVIANTAHGSTPLRFLKSRVLRLYPAAWCCATITFAVGGGTLLEYAKSITLFPIGPWVDTVYWTLAIEISFYLMIFIALCVGADWLLNKIAAALTLASAISLPIIFLGVPYLAKLLNHSLLLTKHGCFFALGILMWKSTQRRLHRWEIGVVTIAVLTGCGEILMRTQEMIEYLQGAPMILVVVPFAIWLLAVLSIWVFSLRDIRAGGAVKTLGQMTYPLYLIHSVVGAVTMQKLILVGFNILTAFLVTFTGTIFLSWIICRFAEKNIRTILQGRIPNYQLPLASVDSPLPLRQQSE